MNEARSLTLRPKSTPPPPLLVLLFLVDASLGLALDLKTVASASVRLGATRLTRNNDRRAGVAHGEIVGLHIPLWDGSSRVGRRFE